MTNVSVFLKKATIKKKELERKVLGINLYDMHQEMLRQQSTIDSYHESLSHLIELRQEMETQLENSKKVYKSEQEKLNIAQKRGLYSRYNLQSLQLFWAKYNLYLIFCPC